MSKGFLNLEFIPHKDTVNAQKLTASSKGYSRKIR